ncbi:MAG: LamG domain-containing protein [Lentisphaeraceae bacterium]|nr:LamG domain-containing protein [Lentisphaeraceae bacterium]
MSEHLDDLIERHLNDELSTDEKAELAELLDSNPDARKKLVNHSEFNSAVTSVLSSQTDLEIDVSAIGLPQKNFIKEFIPWIIALAACLLLFFKTPKVKEPVNIATKPTPTVEEPLTAILVNEANAKFANGRSIADVKFSSGKYKLTEGVVHLRFSSGADLVVEAPAEIDILDSMNAKLVSGKVRAIVPPPAHGFTVSAYDVNYEDIGTEFGLIVNSETSSSELHVFDGQVNVKDPATNKLLKKVFRGQAVVYEDGQKSSETELQPEEFLTVGKIGFKRWHKQISELAKDPAVIACYPFLNDSSSVLQNTASDKRVTSGTIKGARWVSGRWPGKQALLFDRKDDYVELDIPLQLDEFSVSMWFKIDRQDTLLSPLFNSNKWDEGDVHLQMLRFQQPHFDVFGTSVGPGQKRLLRKPVAHSEWVHITLVLSSTESYGKVYVNGREAVQSKFPMDAIIKPGKCRIGSWVPIPGYEPERIFNGRIDEVVIWKKVLTQIEVTKLVESGRPSLLWSVD